MMNRFDSQEALIAKLSAQIANEINTTIEQKGEVSIAVSGGSTPEPLFQELSKLDLPWEKVTITQCDERMVEHDSNDSNVKLIQENLLQNYAKKAKFFPLYNQSKNIDAAINYANELIGSLTPIDIVILGMGEDGHTASLFPNNEKLPLAYDLNNPQPCIHIIPNTAAYDRISLTLPSIINSSKIYLHFEGDKKLEIFNKAMQTKDKFTYPIASVFEQKEIEVYCK